MIYQSGWSMVNKVGHSTKVSSLKNIPVIIVNFFYNTRGCLEACYALFHLDNRLVYSVVNVLVGVR